MGALGQVPRTSYELATQLGEPLSAVHDALVRIVEAGLAEADDGRVWLTEAGLRAVAAAAVPRHDGAPVTSDPVDPVGELMDVARSVGSSWIAHAAQASVERQAATDAVLASDADRDRTVQRLAEAFAQGRLQSAELEERTGRALAARTHGDLDEVLDGLGGPTPQVRRHPVRTVVFWVATVLLSPFLLFGTLFALFGNDLDDHVAGLVFLALTVPPLFALWRWSRPRT
ncbi:MAG TPA: DUF1707 domain-containing protein [Nocardioidaceae bacterium]|nr:DUF1707 domain-containing protein [Nocardioidaceae bacterium]